MISKYLSSSNNVTYFTSCCMNYISKDKQQHHPQHCSVVHIPSCQFRISQLLKCLEIRNYTFLKLVVL